MLLVESGILSLGIRNRAQGIRNPTESGIQNPSSTYKDCNPVAGIPESTAWVAEFKTVLDSLIGASFWRTFFAILCTFVDELSNIALESA